MNEISAIFLKSGTSEGEYVVKDALVRSYALSSQDLSFGIPVSGDTLNLSAKGVLVGSVPLSDLGAGGARVWIEDRISGIQGFSDLSVIKLSSTEYSQLVVSGDILSNCLYVVHSDYVDAYGQQIKHVSAGTEGMDAVNLGQVSGMISGFVTSSDIHIPKDLSAFTNSPGYLTSVPDAYKTYSETKDALSSDGYVTDGDLTAYYLKSETSSASQISGALTSFLTAVPDTYKTYEETKNSLSGDGYATSANLAAFYRKDETSSSSQISNALQEKADISAIPLSTSQLTNDSGFLTAHQSLSNYYQKSQTSSSSQISDALDGKIDASVFLALSGIANPKASVISVQETLISVLTVLKSLASS